MEWVPIAGSGVYRLFCGSVHCFDELCAHGSVVETQFGEDSNEAYSKLLARVEKSKEAV